MWRYRTVSPQKLKNLVFFQKIFWWRCVAIPHGIATEIEKSCFFHFFFWWRCVAIPYGIATEIEKSCFFQLFFLVAMCGDTVYGIATEIEKSCFFQFFFGGDVWRYRTVSPQKLKNLVFFNFFFWWRCVAIPYGIATVRYRHRN